jgi:hypothetical protein
MGKRLATLGIAALALMLAASGCARNTPAGSAPVQESRSQTLKVAGAPLVVVQSDAGPITVTGGSDGEVAVSWQKRAPAKNDARDMQVTVQNDGGAVMIAYHDAGQTHANHAVVFDIRIPKGAKLQVRDGAGPVTVSNLEQGADIITGGGAVTLKGVQGMIAITSAGGDITVTDMDGSIVAETHGGTIRVSGRMLGQNELHTTAGAIDVTVSAGSNLAITAATSAGTITNDFGFGAAGQIGDGSGGTLDLATNAGNIAIHRAK